MAMYKGLRGTKLRRGLRGAKLRRGLLSSGAFTLILDQFTGANGTALTAHLISPTNQPGTAWVGLGTSVFSLNASNQVVFTSGGVSGGIAAINVNVKVTDCTVTCTEQITNNTFWVGLCGRVQDSTNFWYCLLYHDTTPSNDAYSLYENNAGVSTQRGNLSLSGQLALSTNYTLTLSFKGNTVSGTFNGSLAWTFVSSSFNTRTNFGITIASAASAGMGIYDNFTVTVP